MHHNYTLKGLFLVLLISLNLHSSELQDKILDLSKTKYWSTLLHFKNNKSEIDSPNFFLAKDGKYNLTSELTQTIDNLIDPKYKDDNSTYCKYPARRVWIEENFKTIDIKYKQCYALNKELKQIKNITNATLVFPSTHLNSPASMFGHTLLRLDTNTNVSMTSMAINYAASTDEKNGFIYAWRGLTGGYLGKYSIVPYYKKIQEYGDKKSRDIWEYKLTLTKEEIYKMILHLYEVKSSWSYYYYFNKNCSYEILWLLEAARDSLSLTKQFNYKTLPIETIWAIENENLITNTVYRPSKRTLITNYFEHIKDKNLALKFYKTFDFTLLEAIEKLEKIYIIDFSLDKLQFDKTEGKIDKTKYLSEYFKLLKYRSKLGQHNIKITTKPINPILGHKINRLWINYGSADNISIGIKPSLHHFDDLNYAYLDGAYIDFFKISTQIIDDKAELENISFFDIKSLSKRDMLFQPYSWKVDIGAEKFKDDNDYLKLKTGMGVTYGTKSSLFYLLGIMNYFTHTNSDDLGYGIEIGAEVNFKSIKLGFMNTKEVYSFDTFNRAKVFLTYGLTKDYTFSIGYKKKLYKEYGYFGLNYYF